MCGSGPEVKAMNGAGPASRENVSDGTSRLPLTVGKNDSRWARAVLAVTSRAERLEDAEIGVGRPGGRSGASDADADGRAAGTWR